MSLPLAGCNTLAGAATDAVGLGVLAIDLATQDAAPDTNRRPAAK